MNFQSNVTSAPDPLLHQDNSAADTSSDMSFSSESSENIESTHEQLHPNRTGQETVSVVGDIVVDDGNTEWEDESEDESASGDDSSDGMAMVLDVEEDDQDGGDDINMAAYDNINMEHNGLIQTEQAGVIHLVHGWTMRGHPSQVGQ